MLRRLIVTAALTIGLLAFAGTATALHEVNDRMIGGGWLANPDLLVGRVTLGFELPCTIDNPDYRPNLEVNWRENRFRLSEVSLTSCSGGSEGGHSTGIVRGAGVGTCNGQPATATFTFSADLIGFERVGGDRAELQITGAAPGCTLALVETALGGGNFRFIEDPNI